MRRPSYSLVVFDRSRRKHQREMKWLISFILAIVLIAAEGKALNDVENQHTNTQESSTFNPINEIKNIFKNLETQFPNQNLPNQNELINTFKQHSTNLVNNINEYLKNATEEIKTKNPELESLWTNFKGKLSEAANKLNINTETTEQLNQLNTKFQEGIQTILTESENTAKAISENSAKVQEGISKLTKQAIDIAVQASQNLNTHLQATTPHP